MDGVAAVEEEAHDPGANAAAGAGDADQLALLLLRRHFVFLFFIFFLASLVSCFSFQSDICKL